MALMVVHRCLRSSLKNMHLNILPFLVEFIQLFSRVLGVTSGKGLPTQIVQRSAGAKQTNMITGWASFDRVVLTGLPHFLLASLFCSLRQQHEHEPDRRVAASKIHSSLLLSCRDTEALEDLVHSLVQVEYCYWKIPNITACRLVVSPVLHRTTFCLIEWDVILCSLSCPCKADMYPGMQMTDLYLLEGICMDILEEAQDALQFCGIHEAQQNIILQFATETPGSVKPGPVSSSCAVLCSLQPCSTGQRTNIVCICLGKYTWCSSICIK